MTEARWWTDSSAPLDHVVFASPDLAGTVEWFTETTGVRPVPGGQHVGAGTANFLVGLGGGAYLEIIGPDPHQPDPDGPRPFGVDQLRSAGIVTWAVRVTDIEARIGAARSNGYDPGAPREMSRQTPDGVTLRWRLTYRPGEAAEGLVPFLIDWGDSPHPAAGGLPSLPLLSFTASHPAPDATRRALTALGVGLPVRVDGQVGLTAVVVGAHGPVALHAPG